MGHFAVREVHHHHTAVIPGQDSKGGLAEVTLPYEHTVAPGQAWFRAVGGDKWLGINRNYFWRGRDGWPADRSKAL